MPCQVTLAQLVEILHATPLNLSESGMRQRATGIVTDSRNLPPGSVFVALRGEKFDGHAFITTALEQGAIAAVVDQAYETIPPGEASDLPLLQVSDTLAAYQ